MSDEPIIRLVNVSKSFGLKNILHDVTLSFDEGKITVVLGPSGVGKSVMLKHIVSLLKPDSGEVWFEGKRIDDLAEHQLIEVRSKIGYLFQMGALFDSMNVHDNICFPLVEHTKMSPAKRSSRCKEVLGMVGLDGVQRMMPGDLSGGQRKRVALARAVVLGPKVVLYDEPTTGLDPIRADVINELILALSDRLGITSIVVTHDMHSANKIADRMVMLYDGGIIADGDPASFRGTDNDMVQRFIAGKADQADLELIHGGFGGAGHKTT